MIGYVLYLKSMETEPGWQDFGKLVISGEMNDKV